MKCAKLLLGYAVLLSGLTFMGHAEYAVDWFKISGGGGNSHALDFGLSATIGQADVGTISGGDYAILGGFWGAIPRGAAPGVPMLSIALTTTNSIALSWPYPSSGFVLEEAELTSGNWTTVDINPAQTGTQWLVTLPVSSAGRFYRLRFQ